MLGYDFHRQRPIGNYIVDFFCQELKLAIEIDGNTYNTRLKNDFERQSWLESQGISVLRFQDRDIKTNLAGVLIAIEEWIERHVDGLADE